MSLRIIANSQAIQRWITDRNGTPARKTDDDSDLRVLFANEESGYERMSTDEFIEAMHLHHLVLLVEQEPGKTFHKFVNRT